MDVRLKRSERFERIIDELRGSTNVRISQLADDFGVSTETVRRDIDELSRRGLVENIRRQGTGHVLRRIDEFRQAAGRQPAPMAKPAAIHPSDAEEAQL